MLGGLLRWLVRLFRRTPPARRQFPREWWQALRAALRSRIGSARGDARAILRRVREAPDDPKLREELRKALEELKRLKDELRDVDDALGAG